MGRLLKQYDTIETTNAKTGNRLDSQTLVNLRLTIRLPMDMIAVNVASVVAFGQ